MTFDLSFSRSNLSSKSISPSANVLSVSTAEKSNSVVLSDGEQHVGVSPKMAAKLDDVAADVEVTKEV